MKTTHKGLGVKREIKKLIRVGCGTAPESLKEMEDGREERNKRIDSGEKLEAWRIKMKPPSG